MPPPIISWQSPSAVEEIRDACSTWGAFVLIDHGLEQDLLERVLATGHAFFNLSTEQKLQYDLQKHGAKWRGYMRFGGERSHHGQVLDFKEGLYLGDEHAADDKHLGLPTFGSNVFPEAELPHMKALFTEYHEKMKALGNAMMDKLSLGLDLPESYLQEHITNHEPVILPRMFRYPPQGTKEDAFAEEEAKQTEDLTTTQEERYGIGKHSDYGLWTMILTDAPGLEFQHPVDGTWHAVPFVPHSLIMNVGDVLDRLSAGRFVSAYHRALNRTDAPRLSLPFFYDPSWEARMQTLPLATATAAALDTPERAERWSNTKITCSFDQSPGVEYSEFLAKKVAKVFPSLIPESTWQSLKSTSAPSTRHALVVDTPDTVYTNRLLEHLQAFYEEHQEAFHESHGWNHVLAVYEHACKAIACHQPPLSAQQAMEVKIAALLHDADDSKYFSDTPKGTYPNALKLLKQAALPVKSCDTILYMISLVSCSANGNSVPDEIAVTKSFHLLIPRWCDRLEAVGAAGVVRCFQYNQERGVALSSPRSPRAETAAQVWELCTADRFETYQKNRGASEDMMSHYFDKLLHVARPPAEIVRNDYLIQQAESKSQELVEMCVRYGKTGQVDVQYVQELAEQLGTSI